MSSVSSHYHCHPLELPSHDFIQRLKTFLALRPPGRCNKASSQEEALAQCFLYDQVNGWNPADNHEAICLLYSQFLDREESVEDALRSMPLPYLQMLKSLLAVVMSRRNSPMLAHDKLFTWAGLAEEALTYMLTHPVEDAPGY